MKSILVTGANGQLANCIDAIKIQYPSFKFHFASSSELDITKLDQVTKFFNTHNLDCCINCAAYTAVDKAEDNRENAQNVNVIGSKHLALLSAKNDVTLVHISTDFVFDGNHNRAYKEDDKTSPISVYGQTKLDGEREIERISSKHFIIRTSWLYSEFNDNFMKTMLRIAKDKNKLNIVADQIGTPTYAKDLAKVILDILNNNNETYGIYHYSNEGMASWFDFAKAIFDIQGININVYPINSKSFPTAAKRPYFSVLDKSKIKMTHNITIPYWRDSLKTALEQLK